MSDGLLSRYSRRPKPENAGRVARSADQDRARSRRRPQRPGMLILREGKESDRTFEVNEGSMTIGRGPESDIVLEDSSVSRVHAAVTCDAAGNFRIQDQGSANGTSVNGQRISEHVLEDGDEIQVGLTVLTFRH